MKGPTVMRRSGKAKQVKQAKQPKQQAVTAELDAERQRQRAEQLARAIEEFLRRRAPLHSGPECSDGQVEPLDWSAAGCEALCALCLLNRALSIYRMRA